MQNSKHSKAKKTVYLFVLFFFVISLVLSVGIYMTYGWSYYLYTPTHIVKVSNYYIIQDCWNGRILYSKSLNNIPGSMSTLQEQIKGGHSISYDGDYIVVDDSNNNQVLLYKIESDDENITLCSSLSVEDRPHFILNNEGAFYILASTSGTVSEVVIKDQQLEAIATHEIEGISYARSMSIIDNKFYIPTGDGKIYEMDDDWNLQQIYQVSDDIGGMNYITKIDDYFYITIYTGRDYDKSFGSRILRCRTLENLENNNYEDLTEKFGIKGTPYFISFFDDKYYLTEIDAAQGIYEFEVEDNNIKNIRAIYKYPRVNQVMKNRKQAVFK